MTQEGFDELKEDKEKICDWIMKMDLADFYGLCTVLTDCFDFTGEQLFYSCQKCSVEHGQECVYDTKFGQCERFFKEHYLDNAKE